MHYKLWCQRARYGSRIYLPSSCSIALNFIYFVTGLEAQLLGIVVRREKPELEEMKSSLVLSIGKVSLPHYNITKLFH